MTDDVKDETVYTLEAVSGKLREYKYKDQFENGANPYNDHLDKAIWHVDQATGIKRGDAVPEGEPDIRVPADADASLGQQVVP